ncbi:hypothetical protein BC628DRAFT_788753 [Trametes gibbosa]|nr:hypothetical protein BC628DRAFT_788753 [Trametes gibbosa]
MPPKLMLYGPQTTDALRSTPPSVIEPGQTVSYDCCLRLALRETTRDPCPPHNPARYGDDDDPEHNCGPKRFTSRYVLVKLSLLSVRPSRRMREVRHPSRVCTAEFTRPLSEYRTGSAHRRRISSGLVVACPSSRKRPDETVLFAMAGFDLMNLVVPSKYVYRLVTHVLRKARSRVYVIGSYRSADSDVWLAATARSAPGRLLALYRR